MDRPPLSALWLFRASYLESFISLKPEKTLSSNFWDVDLKLFSIGGADSQLMRRI